MCSQGTTLPACAGSTRWLPQLFRWFLSVASLRGQSDAAERFAGAGRTNRDKRVEVTFCCGLTGADSIGDFHQLVGIGAVVAVLADRRCDRLDCGNVSVDDSNHIATSAGRGFDRRGIVLDAIGHA